MPQPSTISTRSATTWKPIGSFFARGQMDFAAENDLIVRGGCFEIGRCFYWDVLPDAPPASASGMASAFAENPMSSGIAGIMDWIEWIRKHETPGIDWRDRFYWEQRVAGWLSSNEQALDLLVGERFHPINSEEAYRHLLTIDPEIRGSSRHQIDLIKLMAPVLAEFSFNPPDPGYLNLLKHFRTLRHCLRHPDYLLRLINRKVTG